MLPGQMSPWQLESVLNVQSFIKIESVTAEILLTFSLWGWVVQSHFIVKPNLVLRLGWGFDNSKYEPFT